MPHLITKLITLVSLLNTLQMRLRLFSELTVNIHFKISHVTSLLYFMIINFNYKTKYNQFIYNDIQLFT